ncbi:MAG: hypothetical protein E6R05_01730 [Candidatus Moraniibacteriota bacterium]|nr:MAG: hypothetical protein E6R05_01730 [Candidatus Moranbacteria bacterium]
MTKGKQIKKNALAKLAENKLTILVLFLVSIGIVFTGKLFMKSNDIYLVGQPNSTNPAVVTCGLRDFGVGDLCANGTRYQTATFICADGTEVLPEKYQMRCQTLDNWYNIGTSLCANRCSESPSPIATVRSSHFPKPSYRVNATPSPSPRNCPQVAGRCVSKTNSGANACAVYTDGCQKNERCAVPFQACNDSINRPIIN